MILRPAAVWLLLLASSATSPAASLITESFTAGLNGWTNENSVVWTSSVQTVRASFASNAIPVSQTASLVATSPASGGAFVGDYLAPGIHTMGFSFFAENVLPTQVKLEWKSGTNTYFQEVSGQVTATGVWYRFVFGLEDRDADGWQGSAAAVFVASLGAVDKVALRVSRNGLLLQAYRIDDVFVDGLPYALAMHLDTGQVAQVTWAGLHSNSTYRLQTAPSASSNYVEALSFTATNLTHTLADTNPPAATGFQRLRW